MATNLECMGLVGDGQIESDSLLEWHLALALLISPLVGGQRVADHVLQNDIFIQWCFHVSKSS